MLHTSRVQTVVCGLPAVAALFLVTAAKAQLQPAPEPSFHAAHYDVDATLSPGNQTLMGQARVELVADQPSRTLEVQLNPDLNIKSIELDGRPLQFFRVADQPSEVSVSLPAQVPVGGEIALSFDYAGSFAGGAESASSPMRLAYIGNDSAYLLLSAGWFPLMGSIGERYTAVFHFTVPGDFVVVGSGTSGVPDTVSMPQGAQPGKESEGTAQWLRYTFTCSQPAAVGTFVAGGLELTPVNEGGLSLSFYTLPKDKATAAAYARQISNIIEFYSSEFGPLPASSLTVAQLPSLAPMNGTSAPGLVLVDQRQWTEQTPEDLLARLIALQWWDGLVMPATLSDAWLSEGLSRYSQVLYAGHVRGEAGLRQAVQDCAIGALMDESTTPIAQAWRLQPYTTAYDSIVRDKGAMVFHMLRSAIGDKAFLGILREYLRQYSGKTATIADFEHLVQTRFAPEGGSLGSSPSEQPQLNAVAFFSQWLNSTGIPAFRLEYRVYRTPKGFKVVGKIEQNLTTLNMPIQVRVQTEGNPVTKTIQVVGTSSEFSVDTFGEPKPDGITLDPNDDVLKSTPNLRVRALIAEGEALAERDQFFQAIQQYQKALDIQNQNALALFRTGEAMFYEKNYQAAANSFRDALDGQIEPAEKWIVVWSHIYLGKIYDLIGQRERALNEYQKALDTKDDTSGALEQARAYMQKPYGPQPAGTAGS